MLHIGRGGFWNLTNLTFFLDLDKVIRKRFTWTSAHTFHCRLQSVQTVLCAVRAGTQEAVKNESRNNRSVATKIPRKRQERNRAKQPKRYNLREFNNLLYHLHICTCFFHVTTVPLLPRPNPASRSNLFCSVAKTHAEPQNVRNDLAWNVCVSFENRIIACVKTMGFVCDVV